MRTTNRLTALAVARLKDPGYYSDGGNLFLQVAKGGTKSWIFRYGVAGKKREMGLGPLEIVPLSKARETALSIRLQMLSGLDPTAHRKSQRDALKSVNTQRITFQECAEKLIESKSAGWKNAKHAQQWTNTLTTYAFPHIGGMQARDIDTAAVRKCIDPIWTEKPETASRLRQRIEAVLDWAKAHDHRSGDNPAAWKGHLEAVMASPKSIKKPAHHAALDVKEVAGFTSSIRSRESTSARALEFLILTAARTGEVVGARWEEIDIQAATWTVPASRMKAKVEHTVPLSARALALLKAIKVEGTMWVFQGAKEGRPLSNMAMLQLMRGMGAAGVPHGLRSTFRQWAAEHTTYPREVAEHALAHRLPDKVEASYQRSTLFVKRRALMNDWAEFLEG